MKRPACTLILMEVMLAIPACGATGPVAPGTSTWPVYLVSDWSRDLTALLDAKGLNGSYVVWIDEDCKLSASRTTGPGVYYWLDSKHAVNAGAGVIWTVGSPEHIQADPRQQIVKGQMALRFSSAGTVYPGWWGAKADGITDDAAAIQMAMNSFSALGGTIRFPPGYYVVTATVATASPASLVGEPGAAIVELSRSLLVGPMVRYERTKGFAIQGLAFAGAQTHADFAGTPDDNRSAIYCERCTQFSIRDVAVTDKTYGVHLRKCVNFIVADSRFVGFADPNDGVGSGHNYNAAVRVGFQGSGGCTDGVVQNCYMKNWGEGVGNLSSSSRMDYLNNTIIGACDNGMYNSSGNYNLYQGNVIRICSGDGIKVRGMGHQVIENSISDCGWGGRLGSGIVATANTSTALDYGLVIADNVVDTTNAYGILVTKGDSGGIGLRSWSITGNHLTNCGNPAVTNIYGMGILVSNNVCSGTISSNTITHDNALAGRGALAAIGTVSQDLTGITISDNLVNNASHTGMAFAYTDGLTLENNTFLEIPGYGIYFIIAGSNTNVACTGNTFHNVTAAGKVAAYGNVAGVTTNSLFAYNAATGNFTVCVHPRNRDATNRVYGNAPDDVGAK